MPDNGRGAASHGNLVTELTLERGADSAGGRADRRGSWEVWDRDSSDRSRAACKASCCSPPATFHPKDPNTTTRCVSLFASVRPNKCKLIIQLQHNFFCCRPVKARKLMVT
ncbi:hypothetical protein Q5P01_008674 [Channa striata]|uniref:Uncharacterized protein n=1 Tax=Channa striata TaxID=64152 RepID=A0AA88SZK3_CHASR|nr:hypothetical protein Q5P01_008674 [Channa striata]